MRSIHYKFKWTKLWVNVHEYKKKKRRFKTSFRS